MINKIRLLLEYNTYCIWLLDEDSLVIANDNPPEWDSDKVLTNKFMRISDLYDSFFIDNAKEFSYIGSPSQEAIDKLNDLIEDAYNYLVAKNNGKYEIINDFNIDEKHVLDQVYKED